MIIRRAIREDVASIVAMLADDQLGKTREDYRNPIPEVYMEAFEKINSDPYQHLIVAEDEGSIVGTLQLSFIQYLTYQGGVRSQIEAVRVHSDQRGKGIGEKMIRWAIKHAKEHGAHVIQLTTDKRRPEAARFYEKIGFQPTHEGMKLFL